MPYAVVVALKQTQVHDTEFEAHCGVCRHLSHGRVGPGRRHSHQLVCCIPNTPHVRQEWQLQHGLQFANTPRYTRALDVICDKLAVHCQPNAAADVSAVALQRGMHVRVVVPLPAHRFECMASIECVCACVCESFASSGAVCAILHACDDHLVRYEGERC